MATSLLDLVGVLLLGLVAALAVTVVQSQPPPAIVDTLAGFLGLGALTGQQLVLVFASAAAVVLLTKSVVSSYLTRRVLIFLANRQALVSARLSKELLSRPLTFLQRRSSQETAFALIQGAGAATIQILGHMVVAVTEIALLVVLAAALLLLDPLMTLGAVAFFALVAFILQKAMGGWASKLGSRLARADVASLNTIQEAVSAYREITVSDRRGLYVDRIGKLRWEAAKVAADTTFIGMFPKYMFEAALVVGGFALAGILFTTQDSVAAVGTLALFLAAGTRVMPSLLRLQGAALGLRSAAGVAGPTFELADELGNPIDPPDEEPDGELLKTALAAGHGDFSASISLRDASFTYPGSSTPALKGVTVELEPGQSLALVGKSGSGKSTLADLILGVLEPDSGSALIGGVPPSEAVHRWPGGIAYVPQEVLLANDTIRNNVALGLPENAIDDDLVWEALRRAHLSEYLTSMREGLDTHIGEGGLKLSGGQRQRLGVARALFTRPRLLVLDEATSALDAETEASITETIAELEGDVTTVIIAHRLSTVRHVDHMVYLDAGECLTQGKFSEIRATVPSLERQATLLGL
jgi:ABC-type multidrug transport system fused ATPase/permease subunit